ncbi:hypothetical protein DCD76_18275, partial [Acinetobacter baumannii]
GHGNIIRADEYDGADDFSGLGFPLQEGVIAAENRGIVREGYGAFRPAFLRKDVDFGAVSGNRRGHAVVVHDDVDVIFQHVVA